MSETTSKCTTRRSVLKAGLAAAVLPAMQASGASRAVLGPSLTAAGEPGRTRRTLVLLHLAGGNDGLNTVIPYRDPLYYESRLRLAIDPASVLPISNRIGLHPALLPLLPLYRSGRLAILQGVGAAEPDYSHIGACGLCLRGMQGAFGTEGARLVMRDAAGSAPQAAALVEHQPGQSAETLRNLATRIVQGGIPSVVFTSISGFDTHEDQLPGHARVLGELAAGLAAFQSDLDRHGIADRVLLVAWSEFGRRIAENATGGTGHGSAGPMLVLGGRVRGGIYGRAPSLRETDFGNLIAGIDCRQVLTTLAASWLGRTPPRSLEPDRNLLFI